MNKLLFILLAVLIVSCNKEVMLNVDPQEQLKPDYNLLSEAPAYLVYDSTINKYTSSPSLYLRPFENVTKLDNVTIKFNSTSFARYIIKNDTLYNEDKINIKYSDFSKYLLIYQYQSESQGQHTITVETTLRDVTKTTTINLLTK